MFPMRNKQTKITPSESLVHLVYKRKHLIKCIHLVVAVNKKKSNRKTIRNRIILLLLLLYWITNTCNYIEQMRLWFIFFSSSLFYSTYSILPWSLKERAVNTVNHFITASDIFSYDSLTLQQMQARSRQPL